MTTKKTISAREALKDVFKSSFGEFVEISESATKYLKLNLLNVCTYLVNL